MKYYELTRIGVTDINRVLDLYVSKRDLRKCSNDVLVQSFVHSLTSDDEVACNHDKESQAVVDIIYNLIVEMLQKSQSEAIPTIAVNALKFWWDQELDVLKEESCNKDKLWRDANCPRSGKCFDNYKDAKYKFKSAIRRKREIEKLGISDSLYENLLQKNSQKFWKTWRTKVKGLCNLPTSIGNVENQTEIADNFAKFYSGICTSNDQVNNTGKSNFLNYLMSVEDELLMLKEPITLALVDKIISEMKQGKAKDCDNLTIEHFQFAHPALIVLITRLLNFCMKRSVMPKSFGKGLMIPIPKDGSYVYKTNVLDYRGITITQCSQKYLSMHC